MLLLNVCNSLLNWRELHHKIAFFATKCCNHGLESILKNHFFHDIVLEYLCFLIGNVLKKPSWNRKSMRVWILPQKSFQPIMYVDSSVEALFDAKRSWNTNCYSWYIQNCYLKWIGSLNWKFKCLFTIFWKFKVK